METLKRNICEVLKAFVNQRPGLDFRDYGSSAAYNHDYRGILQAKHDALAMLRFIELRDSITAENIIEASNHAYSGRLVLRDTEQGGVSVDYCTGQYWPTEYRNAVCAVLAAVIYRYFRNGCGYDHSGVVRQVKGEFGRGLASRWFN